VNRSDVTMVESAYVPARLHHFKYEDVSILPATKVHVIDWMDTKLSTCMFCCKELMFWH